MSIQGVQKKLSAKLKVKEGYFEIVDPNGHYILKPQSDIYPELPENEAITMQEFYQIIPQLRELIGSSFLSPKMQEKYLQLLDERCEQLNIFFINFNLTKFLGNITNQEEPVCIE